MAHVETEIIEEEYRGKLQPSRKRRRQRRPRHVVPSTRLKAMHRRLGSGMSLKYFARDSPSDFANQWLKNKGLT